MTLIRKHFAPMKAKFGWGTNPFYYLAGKYGIHPTYVQETMGDARYSEEDILAVIDHLRAEGGKKFSFDTLEGARHFYVGSPRGSWKPAEAMAGREVLILATGPGVAAHRPALEAYIRRARPLVIALNTQSAINSQLIHLRIACHPVRLLADAETHAALPEPLITPASMLPPSLLLELRDKDLLDFGIGIEVGRFEFHDTHCIAPTSLVMAYSLAVATSGQAGRILMAGFDGYPAGDPRNDETDAVLEAFYSHAEGSKLISITPTRHRMQGASVYSLEF
jgi:4-hydroxy 2-oxovalerate aldolase